MGNSGWRPQYDQNYRDRVQRTCNLDTFTLLPRRWETSLQLLALGCCFQTCLRCGDHRGTDNDLFI